MTSEEVAVGDTQRFECQVIGYPTPTISWYKDDVDITNNPRYNISFNENLGMIILLIKNVTPADEGCYQCRAENMEGFATTTAYLVVKVDKRVGQSRDFQAMTIEKVSEEETTQVQLARSARQTVIEEVITRVEETEKEVIEEKKLPPYIEYDDVLKQGISLKVAATLYIEVGVEGIPTPKVTWYHGDETLEESARVSIESGEGYSFLKIKGTQVKDAGSYKVAAENVAGYDEAIFSVTMKSPPSPPRNLRIVEVFKDFITIAWDEPESNGGEKLLGYQVEKSLAGGMFVSAGHVDYDTTQLKVTKLYEGNEYRFRVMAENRMGISDAIETTKPVKAKLPFDPPGKPRNLRVKEVFKDYITVMWEAPESDGGAPLMQYIIEKRDTSRSGGMWVIAGTVEATEYSFRVTKLFQGNAYQFRVFAENRVGPGEPAEIQEPVVAKLPYDKPLPPRNLRAVETYRDYITIAWDAPESDGGSPITGYIIEKRDAKREGFIYIADVDERTFKFKATRLFEGYDYFFRVIAENQVGPSAPCDMEKPARAKLPYDEPGTPSNLRVTEYWSDFISLAWDAPESDGGAEITGYIIEKRDALRNTWVKAGSVGANVKTFQATKLFEGAEYFFRVYAENKVGPSLKPAELQQPVKAKMPFDPPFAPKNLQVTSFGPEFISITWEAPDHDGGSPLTGYIIEKRNASYANWNNAGKVDANTRSFKVIDLFEGESYFLRVAGQNQVGRGQYIETVKPVIAKLPYEKPSCPQNLRVTDVWRDYINLLWEPPAFDGGAPITGYNIEQRDAFEPGYKFLASVDVNTTSFQATNLTEGHDYYYRVYAQNSAGLSDKPAEIKPPVKARLPFEKPLPPRNLRVAKTGKGLISIAWDASMDDGGSPITAYIIEICTVTQSKYSRVGSTDGNTFGMDIIDLKVGGEYFIRARAENQAGISPKACEIEEPIMARDPIKLPSAPRNFHVTDVSKRSIFLAWDAPETDGGSPVVGYYVEMRTPSQSDYDIMGMLDGDARSFECHGLREGNEYYFRVKARNAAGLSESYAELEKPASTLPGAVPPSSPRDLRVIDITHRSVILSWTPPESDGGAGLTGYTIDVRTPSDNTYMPAGFVEPERLEFKAIGLKQGQEYLFRVRAENLEGLSKEGAELEKPVIPTAKIAVPSGPYGLHATDITADSITVSWERPVNDGGAPIKGYSVGMRTPIDLDYSPVGQVGPSSLSYQARGLKEGKEYFFQVRAENQAGFSTETAELDRPVIPKAKLVAPSAPRNLRVVEVTEMSITIAWDVPESDGGTKILSYLVEKQENNGSFNIARNLDAHTLEVKLGALKEDCAYNFKVYAENSAGKSEAISLAQSVKTRRGTTIPQSPRTVRVVYADFDHITISWDAPHYDGGKRIKRYIITMKEITSKRFKKVGKVDGDVREFKVSENLEEGKEYVFQVFAENEEGISDTGAEIDSPVKVPVKPKEEPAKPKKEPAKPKEEPEKKKKEKSKEEVVEEIVQEEQKAAPKEKKPKKPKKKKVPTATLR